MRRPKTSTAVEKRRPATSEELRAFFGGAARYTGPSADEQSPSAMDDHLA